MVNRVRHLSPEKQPPATQNESPVVLSSELSLHDKWTVNTPLELPYDSSIHPRADEVVLTTWCRSLCDDVCWADQNWQALDIDIQV